MRFKAIGFDFDGTLMMSEGAKGTMMAKAFSEFEEISSHLLEEIAKAYPHLVGRGHSRDEKIKIIAENVLGYGLSSKVKRNIAKSFGKKYVKSLDHCPLFACNKLIEQLGSQVEHMFLLSLEDQKEVRAVAKHCDLSRYFEVVLGGPTGKVEHFKKLLKKWKLHPSEMLYIGDSHGDSVVAKKVGIKGVLIDSNKGHAALHKMLGADFEVGSLCDVKSMFKQMKYKFLKKS